jgi:hypothetical protein
MFNTKNLVHSVKQVPDAWIFEHFCQIPEKLSGQDVKIRSLWTRDSNPSMCIYYDGIKSIYRFKDFSSGKHGDALTLVKELTQLDFHKASKLVVEQYNDFVLHNNGGYDVQEFKQASRYKVTHHAVRNWSTQDQYYWTQFNIGSRLLEEHCVAPLEHYTMERDEKSLTIQGNYLYGYFKKDGTLYKIYQPKTLEKKFIKVSSYIQGTEQLKGHRFLLITSSLKDLMALKSLKLHIDIIAPDSENSMIRKEQMEQYLKSYEKVIVMFDYDDAGILAMQKYQETYPEVATAVLPLSKDPSDSIKEHGVKKVVHTLVPILNRKLENL